MPEACEGLGDQGFYDEACVLALDANCEPLGSAADCSGAPKLTLGSYRVACVWGHVATIADASACAVSVSDRCFATVLVEDPPCYNACESEPASNLWAYDEDALLVHMPCSGDAGNYSGPMLHAPDVDDDVRVQRSCGGSDPPAGCACAQAACSAL